MKMAVMGTGSLGTIFGAYVTKAGHSIDMIDVYKEHVDALNKNGARIIGTVNFVQPVKAITPDQMEGIYDIIFYLTKQTYNDQAFKQMKPHVGKDTVIVSMQNGMPERALSKEFGEEHVMGCPVGWGALLKEPGVSESTTVQDKWTFEVGQIDGKVTPKLEKVKGILETMCPTIITRNLLGSRWTKVFVNATFSGMTAATACLYGDILASEKHLLCAKYAGNEIVKIAKKAGIKMEPWLGVEPEKVAFSTIAERDANTPLYEKMFGPHRLVRASMLLDLERGRKCEINAINGVVCEMGDEYGIDTPLNDQIVDIVTRVQDGKLKLGNHIDLFKIPDVI